MGARRWTSAAAAVFTILIVGCGATGTAGNTTVPDESNATEDARSADSSGPSWCRPAIDDLVSAGLVAVDDGVGSALTGQPTYLVDACYWSEASIFLGRQPSRGNVDYHESEDNAIGPWRRVPAVGEQAVRSVGVGWVFWIRDGHEYVIGTGGYYCFKHKDCKAELVDAARLVDQRLTGN